MPVIANDAIRCLFAMARHDCAALIVAMSGLTDADSVAAEAVRKSTEASGSTTGDVELARDGDRDAFARLVAQHQQQIAAMMWRFTRDRTEWEILVQDVFVEVFCSFQQLKDTTSFESWLHTIATRTGYQFWSRRALERRRANVALGTVEVSGGLNPDAMDAFEAGELVHHLLAQLPTRDRLVLTLMYLESLTVAEVAERCKWSQTMVKVQAYRARKKLKKLLDAFEAQDTSVAMMPPVVDREP